METGVIKLKSHLEGTEKLRELILYVCRASEGDDTLGSIKLNKLLFYSDFEAYLTFGRPITGQGYQKLQRGPAPQQMLPLLEDMQRIKDIVLADRNYHGQIQKRPVALREPDLSYFSAEEIVLVNRVISEFRGMNGTQISEASHDFLGWRLADEKETIPYSAALLEKRTLSLQETAWAHEINLDGVKELLGA